MTDPPGIRIRKDGPYVLTGVPVRRIRASADGTPLEWTDGPQLHGTEQTALCRCGLSAVKPFCDGTHRGQFDGAEIAAPVAGDDPAHLELPVGVAAIDDGPLWVTGSVPLKLSDGRIVETGTGVLLCRCGASGNKPYCDGSHARVGFSDCLTESAITEALPTKDVPSE
ncbi:MAG: zinc finger domain containing protein [Pseudonocardiales bacterium]|nr:zinc finger domain containing protein [Pseudonocardiales bacterium]